ncbi:MAG: hypothetical protein K2Q12_08405 [Rickettsiales bacterium]|nr:hypothetical protein [Rickettsiales bacterium]
MKRATLLATLLATFLAAPAFAQGINFNVPGITAEQSQALQQLMGPVVQASTQFQACVNDKLGQDGMKRIGAEAKIMNREIVAHCKAGKPAEARRVAELYSGTIEGEAAWGCARKLKHYLAEPQVKQMLGKYSGMVSELAEGRLPQNICTGIVTPQGTAP